MKIEIFLEDNWTFWAHAIIGNENIFGTGKDYQELMKNLRSWFSVAFWSHKLSWNSLKLAHFLGLRKKSVDASHI
mgnify:CR=1 FL=1